MLPVLVSDVLSRQERRAASAEAKAKEIMQSSLPMLLTDTLDRVGLIGLIRRAAAPHAGLVLTLNRVLPREERSLCYDPSLVVTESTFVSLLRLLRQDYNVVPLEELLAHPGGSGGRAKVALTFDDGWEDNYRIAFPHLLAFDMPATIFACTELIDTRGMLPEERFARLWSQCGGRSQLQELVTDLNHWGLGRRRKQTVRPRKHYWAREIKRMPLTGRLLLLEHFERRYQVPMVSSRRFLSWNDVRVMLRTGLIRMGSHTSRHAALISESDRDIRRELDDSRKRLWEQTGTVPEMLSYPNGLSNRRVMELAHSAGFRFALGGQPGLVNPRSNPLSIPRIGVRAAVDTMGVSRGEMEFSSSRTSVYFLSSWLRSPLQSSATMFAEGT